MVSQLETSARRIRPRIHVASSGVAFAALVFADIVLRTGGFRMLHSIVKRWPISKPNVRIEEDTIADVCATVDRATSYYVKHTWCLQRAVVTTCLLRAKGIPAQMVIGCRKMPFHGHAWVEVDDRVVNDNQMVQKFYCTLYRC